jgi:hypothetical protein
VAVTIGRYFCSFVIPRTWHWGKEINHAFVAVVKAELRLGFWKPVSVSMLDRGRFQSQGALKRNRLHVPRNLE